MTTFFENSTNLFSIIGGVLALVLLLVFITTRYKIAKPDQALIVTRRGSSNKDEDIAKQKVVVSGGVFVVPFFQKEYKLDLKSFRITIKTEAQDSNGVTIEASAVAIVKIGGREDLIRAAAQRFLHQESNIPLFCEDVLAGSLRGLIGSTTVSTLITDRVKLAAEVLETSSDALTKQGLALDTLQIQGITDKEGYIESLGKPETARAKKEADVAEVNARRDAKKAQFEADTLVLEQEREFKTREAAVRAETAKVIAESEAVKPREDALQRQKIIEAQELAVQKEAALKEQQLNVDVRKVADAEAYRVKIIAEGQAAATLATAEAEKQARSLRADALKLEGFAHAESVEATGRAEAATISARGDALTAHSQAILAQDMLQILPQIAAELAKGYAAIDKLTVISSDAPTSAITKEITNGLTGVTQAVEAATGVDLTSLLNNAVGGAVAGATAAKTANLPLPKKPVKQTPAQLVEEEHKLSESDQAFANAIKEKLTEAVQNNQLELADRYRGELAQMGIEPPEIS